MNETLNTVGGIEVRSGDRLDGVKARIRDYGRVRKNPFKKEQMRRIHYRQKGAKAVGVRVKEPFPVITPDRVTIGETRLPKSPIPSCQPCTPCT